MTFSEDNTFEDSNGGEQSFKQVIGESAQIRGINGAYLESREKEKTYWPPRASPFLGLDPTAQDDAWTFTGTIPLEHHQITGGRS